MAYAVYIGRVQGVTTSCQSGQAQVNRFPGSGHKGFQTRSEAKTFLLEVHDSDKEESEPAPELLCNPFLALCGRSSLVCDHILV